jgi:hypothetical protein
VDQLWLLPCNLMFHPTSNYHIQRIHGESS